MPHVLAGSGNKGRGEAVGGRLAFPDRSVDSSPKRGRLALGHPKKYRQANLTKQPLAVGARARTAHADGGLRYRPPLAAPRELYQALYLHRRPVGW
jgi:hypothetical protein